MKSKTSTIPSHLSKLRTLFSIGMSFALTSATWATSSLNESFSDNLLPSTLTRGGSLGSYSTDDGSLVLNTTSSNWVRSYVRTTASDYMWHGATAPVSYSFTVDSWDGGQIWFYLVGNNPNNLNSSMPDKDNNVVAGVRLAKVGETFSLEFRIKSSGTSAFDGMWKAAEITDLTSGTGTFGFTIGTDNSVSLIANGKTIVSTYTMSNTDAARYNTNATLVLSGINANTGAMSFNFSNISVTQIPEVANIAVIIGIAGLIFVFSQIRKRRFNN